MNENVLYSFIYSFLKKGAMREYVIAALIFSLSDMIIMPLRTRNLHLIKVKIDDVLHNYSIVTAEFGKSFKFITIKSRFKLLCELLRIYNKIFFNQVTV